MGSKELKNMQNKTDWCSSVRSLFLTSSRRLFARRMATRAVGLLGMLAAMPCLADDSQTDSSGNPVVNYFMNWLPRVTQIQSEQPHWVTPLVTVTPRLEEEYRYDQSWDVLPTHNHASLDNFGSNKGLEFIPFDPVEIIVGVPGYEQENRPHEYGWADETFLVKYRILSANEKNGDYILTAFFGLSVPSGSEDFTSHHYLFTPTIAAGKGWGNFDIQSTLGWAIPDNGTDHFGPGMTVASNTTLQYRVAKFFWPEVEANYTWWATGEHEGRNQLLLTPALMIGRIPISGRVGVTFGLGCEFPVTKQVTIHRNVIFSARIPF
jgi:hypothetical protein